MPTDLNAGKAKATLVNPGHIVGNAEALRLPAPSSAAQFGVNAMSGVILALNALTLKHWRNPCDGSVTLMPLY